MRQDANGEDGSISIYLALVLVSILSLVFALIEGSRLYAARGYMKGVSLLAADSIKGSYCRELFHDYGLLFYYGSEQDASAQALKLIQDNTQPRREFGWDLYHIEEPEVVVESPKWAVSENGLVFLEQVTDYMKRAIPITAVSELKEKYSTYKNAEKKDPEEVRKEKEEESKQLDHSADRAIAALKKVRKKKGSLSKYLNILADPDCHPYDAKKAFGNLKKYVNQMNPMVEEAIKELQIYKDSIQGYEVEGENKLLSNLPLLERGLLSLSDMQPLLSYSKDAIGNHMKVYNTEIGETISAAYQAGKNCDFKKIWLPEDEKSEKSIVDYIKDLVRDGKLALVVDDVKKLSDVGTNLDHLPSKTVSYSRCNAGWMQKIYLILYLKQYFGHYRNKKENTVFSYELEYCLAGKKSDKENLEKTVDKLVLLREGLNYVHILKDAKKRTAAQGMAAGLVGWTGIAPLVTATKYLVMAAWALGESILDVKNLLAGGKVPVVKDESQWQTDLYGLFDLGKDTEVEKGKEGLTYEDYLLCLILSGNTEDRVFRAMDIIELNLCKRYGTFRFEKCMTGGTLQCSYQIKPVFSSFWPGQKLTEKIEFLY